MVLVLFGKNSKSKKQPPHKRDGTLCGESTMIPRLTRPPHPSWRITTPPPGRRMLGAKANPAAIKREARERVKAAATARGAAAAWRTG